MRFFGPSLSIRFVLDFKAKPWWQWETKSTSLSPRIKNSFHLSLELWATPSWRAFSLVKLVFGVWFMIYHWIYASAIHSLDKQKCVRTGSQENPPREIKIETATNRSRGCPTNVDPTSFRFLGERSSVRSSAARWERISVRFSRGCVVLSKYDM